MIQKSTSLTISACLAMVLACSQGNGGGIYDPQNTVGTGGNTVGTGGTTLASGGAGGGSSTTDFRQTDHYIAEQIAMTANMVISFLWNRDIQPLGKTPFTASDICLLTGDYTATGTRGFLAAGCTGTATADIDFTMNLCEHQLPGTQESVTFSGDLFVQWADTYSNDCSAAKSSSKTITASGMVVNYKWGYTDFGKSFDSCPIALNYTSSATQSSFLSGRVCDIPVAITFSK